MKGSSFGSCCLVAFLQTLALSSAQALEISEISNQGRPHFLIKTASCVWYYDRAGGGFSRLIDRDGRDWIAFQQTPLSEYPASAAAGYRGLPNAVFVGPDKGAGHPGFDQCESILSGANVIHTTTKSGTWSWTWTFNEQSATFRMELAPHDVAWWFLYEGPVAGTFEPRQKIWGTDSLGLRTDQPSNQKQFFGAWQTLYVADHQVPRMLTIHQHTADELPDNFWYLGSSEGGDVTAQDGMVVVGFGRGAGTTPQLAGSGHQFTVGFVEIDSVEQLSHESILKGIDEMLTTESNLKPREVHFWYGDQQSFGALGLTQRWINVLGQVTPAEALESASFRLDQGPEQRLELGTDLHRLARAGDFNVELPANDLAPGKHEVTVTANWKDGDSTSASTLLVLEQSKEPWPLPFEVDFAQPRFADGGMRAVQEVAQIVDGHWRIETDGLRTVTPWYDRVVGFGDQSWTDYEATVKLTIHGFTPPQPGPPTYNVSHCALALRWYGHTVDSLQPSRQWYPMGCQGELLLRSDQALCQWRALPGVDRQSKPIYARNKTRVDIGRRMTMKARVETLENGESRYAFKHWTDGQPEPDGWFVESREAGETDNSFGSLIIVPHNSDITIHSLRIVKL